MNHTHGHAISRDEEYLRDIKAGGPRADLAISSLYRKHRNRVYSNFRRLISKYPHYKGVVDDLVQDSFIMMIQKIQVEPASAHSLPGFWIGIGKHLLLNQLKKDERFILVREDEEKYGLDENSPESVYLEKEKAEQMEMIFAQLGGRCREILLLWINQYSMLEIAEKMNLSTDAMARKIKFECFKKLKEFVLQGNKMPR